MNMVSKELLLTYNISTYEWLSQSLCDHLCIHRNCDVEILFSTFYQCEENFFLQKHNNCTTHEYPFGQIAVSEDFRRDAMVASGISPHTPPNNATTRITCGNGRYTMLMTDSPVNGLLTCIDHGEGTGINHSMMTDEEWEELLRSHFDETKTIGKLSNAEFGKISQWENHDEMTSLNNKALKRAVGR
jgi:hypothetical protein